jgi:autotransporter-associated beta strand protein
LTFNQAGSGTYIGVVSGSGSLTKSGSGTLALSGANTYSGGTLVSAGVLSGDSTSLQGPITDNAGLTFNQAGSGTYSGVVSGSGSLTKSGSGTLALSGANTYSGGTLVSAGVLSGDSTSLQGPITDNAGLTFNQAGSGTYSGVVSGSGSLTKSGSGTLVLGSSNAYSGGTIVSDGTLRLANARGLGDTNAFVNVTGGALNLGGYSNSVGSATLTSGLITNGTLAAARGVTVSGSELSTISATIAGRGGLTKNGAGTLNLLSDLPAGSVVISGGVMKSSNSVIGVTTNTNSYGGVIVSSNSLWSNSGNLTVGGSGNGTLTVDSAGQVIASNLLIASNASSRGVVVLGTTNGSGNLSLGSGSISFGAGTGVLIVNQGGQLTISNNISGKGVITNSGSGTTTFSGANSSGFTGTTYLSAGTIVLGSGAKLGGVANIANKTAVFELGSNSSLTGTGVHSVAGKLIDNSGLSFTNAIKGSVVLSSTGVLQKTYITNQSVAGFSAGFGAGRSFSILSGTAAPVGGGTLSASIVAGALDFKGTFTNAAVLAITDPSYSAIKNTIQWLNTNVPTGTKPYWTNTVAGNGMNGSAPNVTSSINGLNGKSFAGSFSTFLLRAGSAGILSSSTDTLAEINALSGPQINLTLAKIMGAFGYDALTHTSWAVIDHNSIFDSNGRTVTPDLINAALNDTPGYADLSVAGVPTSVQSIPEPGTWALILFSSLFFIITRRFVFGRSR